MTEFMNHKTRMGTDYARQKKQRNLKIQKTPMHILFGRFACLFV